MLCILIVFMSTNKYQFHINTVLVRIKTNLTDAEILILCIILI